MYKVSCYQLKFRRDALMQSVYRGAYAFIQLHLLVHDLRSFVTLFLFFCTEASSSINTSGDVLTFTDLSGVFYCVLFGMVSSVLVLVVELFIEAHKDTKQNNKEVIYYKLPVLRTGWKPIITL